MLLNNMWRSLRKALTFIMLSILIVVGMEAIIYIPSYGSAHGSLTSESTDFITIVLAAVAVILTALAILLAVAGVVGYTQIKDQALSKAEVVAQAIAEKVALERVDAIIPPLVVRLLKQTKEMPSEEDANEIASAQSEITE